MSLNQYKYKPVYKLGVYQRLDTGTYYKIISREVKDQTTDYIVEISRERKSRGVRIIYPEVELKEALKENTYHGRIEYSDINHNYDHLYEA